MIEIIFQSCLSCFHLCVVWPMHIFLKPKKCTNQGLGVTIFCACTLRFRIDMPARLLILERFSCQHSLYSGQHDYYFKLFFKPTYFTDARRSSKVLKKHFNLLSSHNYVHESMKEMHPTLLS